MKKLIIALTLLVGINTALTIVFTNKSAQTATFNEDLRSKLFNYWERDNLQNRNQLLKELRVHQPQAYKQLITWNTDWNRNEAFLGNQYQLFSDKLFSFYFLSQKMNWESLERASFKLLKQVTGRVFHQASSFKRYRTRLNNIKTLTRDPNAHKSIDKMIKIIGAIEVAQGKKQLLQTQKGHLNPLLMRATINNKEVFPWTTIAMMAALQFLAGFILLSGFVRKEKEVKASKNTTKEIKDVPTEEINLTDLTEQVLSDLSPIFQSKNLQVVFESTEDFWIKEKKDRLTRTLSALISDIALAVAPRSNDKTLFLDIQKDNESVVLNTKIKDVCLSQAVLYDPYTGNESNANCLEESLEAFEKTTSGKVSVKNHFDPVDKSLSSNINVEFQA